MKKHRIYIWTCASLSLWLCLAGFGGRLLGRAQNRIKSTAKPNILILYADDWRYDTLGAAGNLIIKTPNLDRLAREGVRFTNARVTTAICGVSRASFFTGQWMSRHGNRAFRAFRTPWAETYPGLLRANGYYVDHIGKWHNGKFPAEQFDFAPLYLAAKKPAWRQEFFTSMRPYAIRTSSRRPRRWCART